MTARNIALLAIIAGIATLIFVYGHKRGRRSCRNDYSDGFDCGQKAERDWWEHAAGITRDALARLQARDRQEPGPERQWPYGFRVDPVLPETEVLLAEADTVLGKRPHVPSVAELDQMVAEYESSRAPVVADLTGPAAWHYPEDDVPTLTGLVVSDPRCDRTGPEWLAVEMAAQDSEAAAFMRRQAADAASFLRGITTGSTR